PSRPRRSVPTSSAAGATRPAARRRQGTGDDVHSTTREGRRMKRYLRGVATIGAASLVAGLLSVVGVAVTAAPALADTGCTTLGGSDVAGTCTVSSPVAVTSTPVTVAENLHFTSGAHVTFTTADFTLNVDNGATPANFVMDANSSIDGASKNITVNVP